MADGDGEPDYEAAYTDLVARLGGAIDGCSHAAERGSVGASKDMQVWVEVEEIVDDVADEHGTEGVWET